MDAHFAFVPQPTSCLTKCETSAYSSDVTSPHPTECGRFYTLPISDISAISALSGEISSNSFLDLQEFLPTSSSPLVKTEPQTSGLKTELPCRGLLLEAARTNNSESRTNSIGYYSNYDQTPSYYSNYEHSEAPQCGLGVDLPCHETPDQKPGNLYTTTLNTGMPLVEERSQQLRQLASNPLYQDLQSSLYTECTAQESTPHALMTSQTCTRTSTPITLRISVLNLRFMKITQSRSRKRVQELQSFYYLQSAELESCRVNLLQTRGNTSWLTSSINTQYDQFHDELIDRIEQSLALIERNLVDLKRQQKRKRATVSEKPATSPESTTTGKQSKQPVNEVAIQIMTNWYERNKEHPYPSYEAAGVIAAASDVSVDQVKKWFANRRLKLGDTKSLREIAKRRKCVPPTKDDIWLVGANPSE